MPVRAIAAFPMPRTVRVALWYGICVLGSSFAPSAFAQDVPPLRPHPIGEAETIRLMLDMIERFVPRCEAAWREGGLAAERTGSFDADGRETTRVRATANVCLAYAVLLHARPDQKAFGPDAKPVPRETLLAHAAAGIRYLGFTNRNHPKSERPDWGGPSWTAAIDASGAAWAARILEGRLDPETAALAKDLLAAECDALAKMAIPERCPDDAAPEAFAANAVPPALAAAWLAGDRRAAGWDELAKRWALNAVGRPADRFDGETKVDGKSLRERVVAAIAHPDGTVEHRGAWSPAGQVATRALGEAALAGAWGKPPGPGVPPVPGSFRFRSAELWRGVVSRLMLWDGDLLLPPEDGAAGKSYPHLGYLAMEATLGKNPAAVAWEERAIQAAARRQSSGSGGSFAGADFGRETGLARGLAFAVLFHRAWPVEAGTDARRAGEAAAGPAVFPQVRTAVLRTTKGIAVFTWGAGSQSVQVLPECDSSFAQEAWHGLVLRNNLGGPRLVQGGTPAGTVRSREEEAVAPGDGGEAKLTTAGGRIEMLWERRFGSLVHERVAAVAFPEGPCLLVQKAVSTGAGALHGWEAPRFLQGLEIQGLSSAPRPEPDYMTELSRRTGREGNRRRIGADPGWIQLPVIYTGKRFGVYLVQRGYGAGMSGAETLRPGAFLGERYALMVPVAAIPGSEIISTQVDPIPFGPERAVAGIILNKVGGLDVTVVANWEEAPIAEDVKTAAGKTVRVECPGRFLLVRPN